MLTILQDIFKYCTSPGENEFAEMFIIILLVFIMLATIYLDSFKWWEQKNHQHPANNNSNNFDVCNIDGYKSMRSISSLPGPKPVPFKVIGNLFQLPRSDVISKCFEWTAKYGPCFRLTLFNEDFVVISSAQLAQSILQSNELGHLTKTDVYHFLQGIDGLAFSSGPWWRQMRKVATTTFRYQKVNQQIQVYNNHGDQLVHTLGLRNIQRATTSTEALICNCTVQIIIDAFITFPGSSSYAESLEYMQSWKRFTEITAHRIMNPWLGLKYIWKLHPQRKELDEEIGKVEKYAKTLISRHKIKMNNSKDSNKSDLEDKSLISELLHLNYTEKEIQSEVVAMLFAHETNSLGLYYFLYLLAAHPSHQTLCRQEVDILFQGRRQDPPDDLFISHDDLSNLKYLERCLMESLRLLPPVFIFGRKMETELTLPNGVHLPSGTNTLILSLVIHKMEEYYKNPNVFDPDRFLLAEELRKRHPFAYLPFSAGPRICLGMKSSIANIKIVTAKILRKFVISSHCRYEDLRFRLNLTLATEQDLDLQFEPRNHNNMSNYSASTQVH